MSCIYCDGTGRTKKDPYYCEACNTHFIGESKDFDTNMNLMYLNGFPVSKSLSDASNNWSKEFIINGLKERRRPVTSTLELLLDRLDLELFKVKTRSLDNQQVIIGIESMYYEYALIPWAYKVMKEAFNSGYTFKANFLNMEYLQSVNIYNTDILKEELLIIEVNIRNLDQTIKILDTLSTIRKRSFLPTYIITKLDLKTINNIEKDLIDIINLRDMPAEVSDFSILTGITDKP